MTKRTMKAVFGFEIDQDVEMELPREQLDTAARVIVERLVDANVACARRDAL